MDKYAHTQYSIGFKVSQELLQDDAYMTIVRGAFTQLLKPGLKQAWLRDFGAPGFVFDPESPARLDPLCAWPPADYQPEDWPSEPWWMEADL